jgi:hypothetical protein
VPTLSPVAPPNGGYLVSSAWAFYIPRPGFYGISAVGRTGATLSAAGCLHLYMRGGSLQNPGDPGFEMTVACAINTATSNFNPISLFRIVAFPQNLIDRKESWVRIGYSGTIDNNDGLTTFSIFRMG